MMQKQSTDDKLMMEKQSTNDKLMMEKYEKIIIKVLNKI